MPAMPRAPVSRRSLTVNEVAQPMRPAYPKRRSRHSSDSPLRSQHQRSNPGSKCSE
jgi:hypothetical protein